MYGQQQGGGYPGSAPQSGYGGYPGNQQQQQMRGGYPGSNPGQGGGYPGSAPPQQQQQQQGGYQPLQQSYRPQNYSAGPPASEQIQTWFRAVDTDNSGQIDAAELKKALVNGNWSNFSEEACTLMISMFDRTRSGTISINEFGDLYNYINQWKAIFEGIDRDRSGFIEQNELMAAFQQMGYRFTPTFVQNLLSKYDPQNRRLTLDNFIVSSVQIKRLTDSFRVRDKEMKGQATLGYEDFVGLALGTHH
eukprot:TRINITY_DN60_c0_g1_i3.p1 TRINITY_DN60_c0_g1~~TRINITY_DN60_c0_g1_i3.p1  ORF type:complete len:248 (+),score=72.80 TRINITY_DN60_c0_g1_i3:348-1091(+)